MSVEEKQKTIMGHIRNSVRKIGSSNWQLRFSVVLDDGQNYTMCLKAFRHFMDISEAGIRRLIKVVKNGGSNPTLDIDDMTPIETEFSIEELKRFAEVCNLKFSEKQIALVKVPPRSEKAKALVNWLDRFITVASCVNPTNGKLQIELCGLDDLYLMYVNDFTNIYKAKVLGKVQFRKYFKDIFGPVVQVRKRKSVTGKCNICALLSFIRMRSKSHTEIEAVSKLHAIHKMGFMGERMTYYERRAQAMLIPKDYLSLITDGMTQLHCILPFMKGKVQPSNVNLNQHLQGTLVHGQGIFIYRTFNNVKVRLILHEVTLQLFNFVTFPICTCS